MKTRDANFHFIISRCFCTCYIYILMWHVQDWYKWAEETNVVLQASNQSHNNCESSELLDADMWTEPHQVEHVV